MRTLSALVVLTASGCTALTASLLGWYFTGSYEIGAIVAAGTALWTAELFTGVTSVYKNRCNDRPWLRPFVLLVQYNLWVPIIYGSLILHALVLYSFQHQEGITYNLSFCVGVLFQTLAEWLLFFMAAFGIVQAVNGVRCGDLPATPTS